MSSLLVFIIFSFQKTTRVCLVSEPDLKTRTDPNYIFDSQSVWWIFCSLIVVRFEIGLNRNWKTDNWIYGYWWTENTTQLYIWLRFGSYYHFGSKQIFFMQIKKNTHYCSQNEHFYITQKIWWFLFLLRISFYLITIPLKYNTILGNFLIYRYGVII